MNFLDQLSPVALPLRKWDDGSIRIGDSRVPIERVVFLFNQGQTPEQIVLAFPSLQLDDVYVVVAQYLRHRKEIDAYVRQRELAADAVEVAVRARFGTSPARQRIVAQRSQGAS